MNVGQRIKQLRVRNRLTQEELASRCELTKGFLSQLENDLATPSLPTLMDIVEALGTTMSQFFSEDDEPEAVFDSADYFVDERDDYSISWIVPNAQKNEMEPIIINIKPGCSSMVISPNEGEEFGYVLSGQVTLVNGIHELSVKKGSTFYIAGKYEHFLRNDSASNAEVLWICTPPLF